MQSSYTANITYANLFATCRHEPIIFKERAFGKQPRDHTATETKNPRDQKQPSRPYY